MLIRRAREKELNAIEKIYAEGRAFMRQTGNTDQWKDGYPSEDDIKRDLDEKTLYVAEEDGKIACVFCCMTNPEPTYEKIYEGSWKHDGPYATVHRIAASPYFRGKGVAGLCFDFALSFFGDVRADTHRDNIPMQKALLKNGFEYCGIIYLKNGDERLAYQRHINNETGELLDALDIDGRPTGRTIPRGERFGEDEYRRVVHIVILSTDGRMLIQQRQFFKSGWPGQWDVTVGGSALAGETGREAAERELAEEIGLSRNLARMHPTFTIGFDRGFDDFFVFVEDVDETSLGLQTEEVRAVRWATCEEIFNMIDSGEFIPYKKEFIRLLFTCDSYGMLRTLDD